MEKIAANSWGPKSEAAAAAMWRQPLGDALAGKYPGSQELAVHAQHRAAGMLNDMLCLMRNMDVAGPYMASADPDASQPQMRLANDLIRTLGMAFHNFPEIIANPNNLSSQDLDGFLAQECQWLYGRLAKGHPVPLVLITQDIATNDVCAGIWRRLCDAVATEIGMPPAYGVASAKRPREIFDTLMMSMMSIGAQRRRPWWFRLCKISGWHVVPPRGGF
jgi:hypothetical protein